MTAFYDAVCPQCRTRIGWSGRVSDRPACHRCGYRPTQTAMAREQQEIDEARELFRELQQANPNWDQWHKARIAAGLTLRQAARLLTLAPTVLSAIEQGHSKPDPDIAARMAKVYGGS